MARYNQVIDADELQHLTMLKWREIEIIRRRSEKQSAIIEVA